MAKLIFKDTYSEIRKKEEFYKKHEGEDMTDQSQLCGASIVEMAKKFGIEAIIAKAEATEIDDTLKDKLYGNDFTNMFKNKEDMLNTRKKIMNLFENIPARIRKEQFGDDVASFLNAYTTNDENKLGALNKIGIVSDTQLNSVKEYNKLQKQIRQENETRKRFTELLEQKGNILYENFKKFGDITKNNQINNTASNQDVQTSI